MISCITVEFEKDDTGHGSKTMRGSTGFVRKRITTGILQDKAQILVTFLNGSLFIPQHELGQKKWGFFPNVLLNSKPR